MQYRQLGDSGLLVSEIILGTVPFGGRAEFAKCGAVDVPTAQRMFDIAFEAGVNMIDTAGLYSHGLAEEIVGQNPLFRHQQLYRLASDENPGQG